MNIHLSNIVAMFSIATFLGGYMSYQLISLDMDGTLLDENLQISDENVKLFIKQY